MVDVIRTLIDVVGLALVAAGAAAAVFTWVGWSCLAVAGVVLLVGSFVASRFGDRS